VPNFTWDVDPVAIQIDKSNLILALGALAVLMLLIGIVKKQSDLSVFGLFLGGVVALLNNFVPDPVGIRYYSLLFVGVFLGGYALLNWQIQRGGGDEEAAGDFIVYGVAGVLIGSRLGHVIFYDLDKALDDPMWVFQIWTGGLASHGAVLGLIFAMWLFTKRRGVPFLEGADRFSFSAALGATLVRLGNFFNSEIVGRETNADWGVRFPRYDVNALEAPLRYPSQLLEVLLGLFVLLCLYVADRVSGQEKRPRGLLISVFFLVYFSGRFLVEFVKEYQTLEKDSLLTMGQILSIPGIFIGVVGLIAALKYRVPAEWPTSDDEEDESDEIGSDEVDGSDEDEDEGKEADRSKLYDPDVDEELAASDRHEDEDEDEDEDETNKSSPASDKSPSSKT
jgi:prolipoprotein diacylglyceryl transferase